MTIGAHDFALRDLVQHRLPAVGTEVRAYLEALIAEVVEIEHDRVRFAAFDTGVLAEVSDEELGSFDPKPLFDQCGLVDVSLSVCGVVLLFVGSAARPAKTVALAFRPAPPCELLDGLRLSAPGTLPRLHSEHMFVRGSDGKQTRVLTSESGYRACSERQSVG
ncbi:MAG: hypothetical protein H0V29_12540 [Thermoleophilaceae bacterium]|nr:hypothetical protein [Thermoleophilaceae bacterium]